MRVRNSNVMTEQRGRLEDAPLLALKLENRALRGSRKPGRGGGHFKTMMSWICP